MLGRMPIAVMVQGESEKHAWAEIAVVDQLRTGHAILENWGLSIKPLGRARGPIPESRAVPASGQVEPRLQPAAETGAQCGQGAF